MSRKYLTKATQVFLGAVVYNRANSAAPGVEITPQLRYHSFGVVATASSVDVCASQGVTAGTPAVINGTLASAGVATFPTPRNIVAAWTTTSVMTVVGTDVYGSIMTEVSASGTAHTGKKAFKTITSINFSITVSAFTAGTGVVLGLPTRTDVNGIVQMLMDSAATTVTFAVADTTSPATGTTGDVRGTVSFASAPNGTRNFAVLLKISDPATKVGSYGVLNFGSTDSA